MRTPVRLVEADSSCGAKAATLGRLSRAGVTVPDGFVVPDVAAGGWERELPLALEQLGGSRFAVRSSAAGEDSTGASFAGQYLTLLDVSAPDLVQAVRQVAASGPAAAAYAAATGRAGARDVAVLVQPMLAPVAAGVAFTRHPVTGARTTVVEAVRGLGAPLVAGRAVPQRWQAEARAAPRRSGTSDVLSTPQARAVIGLAQRVEGLLGGGQDIEWALDAEGVLWVLQSRPITTGTAPPAEPQDSPGRVLAAGTAASPGTGRGRVRKLSGLDDFARFQAGDVLVCQATSPAWTSVLARAAAVVTRSGGILAHAAIVARELRIPAVTDVPETADLPEGALVLVNGSTGLISLLEEP
ncbi:PEP/pyruvate-binding domain-containing protein [Arthrobacter sp. TMN-37]